MNRVLIWLIAVCFLLESFAIAEAQTGSKKTERQTTNPVPHESMGLKPISEMTADDRYKNQDGGLYGNGRNSPPEEHRRAAELELANIQPLDFEGQGAANADYS